MILIKVTVIGYWGGYPGVGEATSGYLLEEDGFRILIDCGSGVVSQIQKYISIETLDAVILSHYHHDHVADIGPLQYGMLIQTMLHNRDATLPIYGHMEDEVGYASLTKEPYTKGCVYNPNEGIKLGPFMFTFSKTVHPVPCYAMRITNGSEAIVYTADTSFYSDLVNFAMDVDLLICECNLYAGMDGSTAGHMNSTDAAMLASNANVKQLLLTHLPHFGTHEQLLIDVKRHYQGKVELAYGGWSISSNDIGSGR